jgi:hypothetical protein
MIVMDIDRTDGGQGVRSPFHGGESGSIPLGSATSKLLKSQRYIGS